MTQTGSESLGLEPLFTFITLSAFLRLWISSFMLDPSFVRFVTECLKSACTAAKSSDSNLTCSKKHKMSCLHSVMVMKEMGAGSLF